MRRRRPEPRARDRAWLFDAASLAFATYMADPTLRRDLDVLVDCGRIQEAAARDCADTPAGWFARASFAYTGRDDQAELARRACSLVADALESEVPS